MTSELQNLKDNTEKEPRRGVGRERWLKLCRRDAKA